MDEQTLKALNDSINNKWKGIRYEGKKDQGASNCKLCKLFLDFNCRGCPVFERTGIEACERTPYVRWKMHHRVIHPLNRYPYRMLPDCVKCETLCDEEIAFLESLLPNNRKEI